MKLALRVIVALVVLALLGFGALMLLRPAALPAPGPERARARASDPTTALLERGEYLARAGDCVACHTAATGKPFAGGRAMPTPFGVLFVPNITPDDETDIGRWSADDFYRMMHTGVSKDGTLLYPAMPFASYTKVTGCAPLSPALVKTQIWLWFVGMLVLSMPWHLVGLMGMPRRMAYYDFSNPQLQPQAWTVAVSAIGGFILLASGILLVYTLATAHRPPPTAHRRRAAPPEPFSFSRTAHTPVALNGFGLWVAMMIGLTVVNYGYPIAQLALLRVLERRCAKVLRRAAHSGRAFATRGCVGASSR